MVLEGAPYRIAEIPDRDAAEMCVLMQRYYRNVTWDRFYRDLREKDWAIVFRDAAGAIMGFSTLLITEFDAAGSPVTILFSGDTVMHENYWGKLDLPYVWGRFVFMTLPARYPERRLFWILISKGYKTYRYLPTHFLSFYPRYDRETPAFEKTIMDAFCALRFPRSYDPRTGVVAADGSADAVREGIAGLQPRHLENPHLRFFSEINSGYAKGDELVCIVEVAYKNLKPLTRAFLESAFAGEAV